MGIEANGSPLDARSNPFVYQFILIALIVVGVLFLLYLLLKQIQKLHSSDKWIEAHKNLPTTQKDIKVVAKTANLDANEKKILWDICHKRKARNIIYLMRDEAEFSVLLKQAYLEDYANSDDYSKKDFFSLISKIESAREKTLFITSTKSLAFGQEFLYKDSAGVVWTLKLNKNTPQGLYIDIPTRLAQSDKKPEPLSKFVLTFTAKGGIYYKLLPRVIRYELQKDGSTVLIASATNTLKPMQRRSSKRTKIQNECKFSAAQKNEEGKDKFTILDKKYTGILDDISISGCKMLCKMPIKEGQYIYLTFNLGQAKEFSTVGLIIMTKKAADTTDFVLHIKFVDLPLAVQNEINAYVNGYTM